MRRRGFTLVELAIVITLLGIITPMLYAMLRSYDERVELGLWGMDTAAAFRTSRLVLGDDARAARAWAPAGIGLELPDCTVDYRLDGDAFTRDGGEDCGGVQVLARGVTELARVPGGLTLRFTADPGLRHTHHATVFIPVEVP